MSIELNQLPISGGVVVAGLAWMGLSAFALGPLVAERSASIIKWDASCKQQIVQEIEASQPVPNMQPEISCDDVFGNYPPEYRQVLNLMGAGLACQTLDGANQQRRKIETLRQQRLQNAVANAGSRCSCAVAHLIENKRMALALYAGSARLITPASVSDLDGSLMVSANSPACTALANLEGQS